MSKRERSARRWLLTIAVVWVGAMFAFHLELQPPAQTVKGWLMEGLMFLLSVLVCYFVLYLNWGLARAAQRRFRASGHASNPLGRAGIALLGPFVMVVAGTSGGAWSKRDRTPLELVTLIEGFLNDTDPWAWDDLEAVPLKDPELEAIRQRAVELGPPSADEAGLRKIVEDLRRRHA